MNKLEKLIAKLCPNGVDYKPLGAVVDIDKGAQLNRDLLSEDGRYPVINGGINPSGFWNEYNFEKDQITVSQGGASAGYVHWMSTRFWAGAHCFVLTNPTSNALYRYIYFVVKAAERELMQSQIGAGIPSVSVAKLSNILVPLPPLPVQEEIVRMLDGMAGLIDALEQELAARKQQYEWYRDKLLKMTNGGGYRKLTLGEVCDILVGGDVPESCMKGQMNPSLERPYPVYSNGVGENALYGYASEYRVEQESVTISARGTIGHHCYRPGKYTGIVRLITLIPREGLLAQYLNYALLEVELKSAGGGIPQLTVPMIINKQIVVPPLAEQKKIAAKLDAFDKLCNSMTEGLPGEIALRKRQYEFYRDRLLTFKKAG